MKRYLLEIALVLICFFLGFLASNYLNKNRVKTPNIIQIKPRTLDKYTFENLAKANYSVTGIELGKVLKENENFTSYLFTFSFDPTATSNKAPLKKVSGLINIPKSLPAGRQGNGPYPLIVMFRGYVDQKIYQTGMGTQKAGEYFSQNGFITVAPDFLGYGVSDSESPNIFESRFQTYTTAVSLLHSIEESGIPNNVWDRKNIFIWGHSNGGHLALATLEITGKVYPTVLWAPVSQPFPYSILYYLDEADDGGKLIIQKLSDFFDLYDAKQYSITNYYNRINKEVTIQLHQGGSDESVPASWSDNLTKLLEKEELKVNYFYYPTADHNLVPNWNLVVARDLNFFRSLVK